MDIANLSNRLADVDRPLNPSTPSWRLGDSLASLGLFLATAAVVLWQNAHVAVLWDMSYVLDTAVRFAQGQMPYRYFPLVHPPLTFLIQAAIIRLTGRVYFHHALYCAIAGGMGSVVAWRMVLRALAEKLPGAWWISLVISAPLAVVGLYCIFPFPSYDCDTILAVLLALWVLQRLAAKPGVVAALLAGAVLVLPLSVKQNIGIPLVVVALGCVVLLLVWSWLRPGKTEENPRVLLALVAGSVAALGLYAVAIAAAAGLGNYWHWTMTFAGQRRLPGLATMAGVYNYPFVFWALPVTLAGLALLRGPLARRTWAQTLGAQIAAFALLLAPWVYTLGSLALYDDADERGDAFLCLFPLVLALAALWAVGRVVQAVRRGQKIGLGMVVPFAALAAIHGCFMSQQLWGSTYALFPLFVYLCAELLGALASPGGDTSRQLPRWFVPSLAGVCALIVAICGGFYTVSEERLSYANLDGAPANTASQPATSSQAALEGVSTPGAYLDNFDELVAFVHAAIPAGDPVVLIPGEDPFYFATGRPVQFPVLLFDASTDPLTPEQTLDEIHKRHVHWLVMKRALQIREDPTPNRDATLKLLLREFFPVAQLKGYDVYHYAGMHPEMHMDVAMHP